MASLFKMISILLVSVLLTACARLGIKNNDPQYLQATSTQPTYIPPSLSSDSIQAYYPVPSPPNNQNPGNVNLVPPGSVKPANLKKHWWSI